MPTYEFKCSACNAHVERFLSMSEREHPGPCDCGAQGSLRQIITTSPVVVFDGVDTGFPGASAKWEADRQRTIAKEQKNLKETGDYYPNARHW